MLVSKSAIFATQIHVMAEENTTKTRQNGKALNYAILALSSEHYESINHYEDD